MSKDDRGWSTESHEQYMYRLNKEDKVTDKKKLKAIEKGTYEYEYGKASAKQIGGSHYKDCDIQPIDYIVKNNLDFLEGNVIKYITRHKTKGGVEDIKKVIHYAELILELRYGKGK
jgi:hypothetical protein|tara:strand:+ start:1707 stop:2054 length:348 start_codon:yes stop_codon:yes gene_type:complete